MLHNYPFRSFRFLLIGWVWFGLQAWSQSPLPKAMEHSYEEIKQEFDRWQVPEGDHSEEVLLDEIRINYDERGAAVQARRRIWRLTSKQVGEYGVIERQFAPWFENQPTVQARVFDHNGREFKLSKDDITYSPAGSLDQGILSDRMVMRAALPGMRNGAIVEEIVEVREREPFFENGSSNRFSFDVIVPSKFLSIEIDSPESLPIQQFFLPERPDDLHEREIIADGRRNVLMSLDARKFVPIESFESDTPRNVYQLRGLTICTGVRWQQVASQYSQVIENRLEGEPMQELVDEVIAERQAGELDSIEGKLNCCARWMRQNIRYTGVLLGNAAIIPARPSTVVGRRFGDCKDQATLLVGLLREMGVSADVALVNATTVRLPLPDMPCLNSFDHAIVVVRHPSGDLWIDPTNPGSSPQTIPEYLQGRLAIIANPTEEGLTMIPLQGLEGNQDHDTRTMTISPSGLATIVSESVRTGFFASDARSQASIQTFEEESKAMADHYAEAGISTQFKLLYRSDPHLNEPAFVQKTEFRDLQLDSLGDNRFRFELTFRGPVADCRFFHLIEKTERGLDKPRRYASESIVPYIWKRTCKVIAPVGFRISCNLQDHEVRNGPIALEVSSRQLEDGSVTLEQSLTVNIGLISPEELQSLSNLAEKLASGNHPLNFSAVIEPEEGHTNGSRNELIQQLETLRQVWLDNPSGDTGYDYVAALVAVGQVEAARDVALSLIEKFPSEGIAQCAYAYALIFDRVGREFAFGCDVRGAQQACRKAIELSPNRWQPYYLLTTMLDKDDRGLQQNNVNSLNEMLSTIEAAEANGIQEDALVEQKVVVLIRMKRFDEAIAFAAQNGLIRMQNVAKAVKATRESRWGDIVALRENIPSESEREIVGSIAEGFLLLEREYEKSPRVVYILRGMSDRDIEEQLKQRVIVQAVERPANANQSPETVVREYLMRILAQGYHPEAWPELVANCDTECLPTLRLVNSTEMIRNRLFAQKACDDRIYDLCSLYPMRMEGNDEQGYVARIKLAFDCDIAIVQQDEGYKILLSGPGFRDYAFRAQKFLNDGKPDLAIRWIDWALRGQSEGDLLNPESGNPIKRFWTMSRKKTPETIQLVIEMLLAGSELTAERRQVILDAAAGEKSALKRQWLYLSLQMNPKPTDDDALGADLRTYVDQFPNAPMGKIRLIRFEAMQGRFDLAENYIRDTDNVNDPARMEFVDLLRFQRGEVAQLLAERTAQAVKENTVNAWNKCLWAGLFADEIDEQWLEEMREVLLPSSAATDPRSVALHTLCCAEAHVGAVDQAVEHLMQLVECRANRIEDNDFWILGRIAEHCGLTGQARSYYERIAPSKTPASTYQLARQRLSILDANAPSTSAINSTGDGP